MNKNTPILILGAGSIGERHIRNLWESGFHNLIVYRQRNLPYRNIDNAGVQTVTDLNEALIQKPEVAFICTPTSQHIDQLIKCLGNNMHVFVEKPLSHELIRFDELRSIVRQKQKIVQVAFMMHFHPLITFIKQAVEDRVYGKLKSIKSHWGSYLPDWHPYENYKESYAAKKSLGGGVALTLCHDIELALWIAGSTLNNYSSTRQYADELGIEAESIADIELLFDDKVTASIHVNYLDNPPVRTYFYEFDDARITMDYFQNSLKIHSTADGTLTNVNADNFERNQLYISEIEHFFNAIETTKDPAIYSLDQISQSELVTKICIS